MTVAIIGNGLIGGRLVAELTERGVSAQAYGRRDGVDVTTGQGLDQALAGADTVVDVTNAPSWADDDVLAFFTAASKNLQDAGQRAGVRHHVVLSIVGVDRAAEESGYLRGKLAQEQAALAGAVPATIVRAAQFFEFVPTIAEAGADTATGTVRLTDATLQPIAADEVVRYLADVVTADPRGVVEIAGPEKIGLAELARRQYAAAGEDRTVVVDRDARYFGARLDDATLTVTPGVDGWQSDVTYDEWLRPTPGADR